MFWPVVLPFEITFWLMLAVVVISVAIAFRFHVLHKKILIWTLLIAFIAYVPACTGVMVLISPLRFGSFEYDNYDSLPKSRLDRHLRYYLPTAAVNIHAHVSAAGFEARYNITRKELEAWWSDEWQRYMQKGGERERPESPSIKADEYDLIQLHEIYRRIGDEPSTMTGVIILFHGPREPDGGGSEIYFSETEGIACQSTGYW